MMVDNDDGYTCGNDGDAAAIVQGVAPGNLAGYSTLECGGNADNTLLSCAITASAGEYKVCVCDASQYTVDQFLHWFS